LQYAQDYDEKYVLAMRNDNGPGWEVTWAEMIQPYTKSVGVFMCPSDSRAGQLMSGAEWWGGAMSYACNAVYNDGWAFPGIPFRGICAYPDPANASWLEQVTARSLSTLQRPAETIMISEKHSGDSNFTHTFWPSPPMFYNRYGFGPNTLMMGVWNVDAGFGEHGLPNGTLAPNPTLGHGRNGAVSARHNEMANFLFADGHVKAMRPEMTNPNGVFSQSMWNATRN
jgi:prepilin-type processing-associated H-X9-DG protein